jgi:hypothetical protein
MKKKYFIYRPIFFVGFAVKIHAQDKGSYKYIQDWSYWQAESQIMK